MGVSGGRTPVSQGEHNEPQGGGLVRATTRHEQRDRPRVQVVGGAAADNCGAAWAAKTRRSPWRDVDGRDRPTNNIGLTDHEPDVSRPTTLQQLSLPRSTPEDQP
jgi:hypothetical protein